MGLKISVLPCLTDNYGFILHDEATGLVACIDTPEAGAIAARISDLGLNRLDYILNTHWHPDHAGGNAALQAQYGAVIYGPDEVRKIAPLDHVIEPGAAFMLGETKLDIISLKGHTLEHIGYVDAAGHNAFIGDCLFPLGCGRLFEGTREEMWASELRIAALPADTWLYSAHEYSLASLKFAESLGMGAALSSRAQKIRTMRERGEFTVPSQLCEELATNPFLRYPLMEQGFEAQAARFGDLRAAKDIF